MGSSSEFQEYKRLYHEVGLPIVEVYYEDSTSVVVFEDGNSLTEVRGDSNDFQSEITKLVPSVRQGKRQLIDYRETHSESPWQYHQNAKHFATDLDKPVDEMALKIKRGEVNVPTDFDATEALDAALELNLDNPELQKLVDNYFAILALFRSDTYKKREPFKKYRSKVPYNEERFDIYYNDISSILSDYYMSKPALLGYEEFRNNTSTDMLNLSTRYLQFRERKELEWKSLLDNEIRDDSDGPLLSFKQNPRFSEEAGEKSGQIKARIGIDKILGQYKTLFELSREPLQDIAATLDVNNTIDANKTSEALSFLESNNEQTLTDAIERQLRHGSAHESLELDDEDTVLRIFDNRGENRTLEDSFRYAAIPEMYYEFADMVGAILFAFTFIEDHITLKCMSSADFQYHLVENMKPDSF